MIGDVLSGLNITNFLRLPPVAWVERKTAAIVMIVIALRHPRRILLRL